MPEKIQSLEDTDEIQRRVQDKMEEALQLVSALESEMRIYIPSNLIEEHQQESVEAFAYVLATLDASDNEDVQEALWKMTKQGDVAECVELLGLDALIIWKGMEMTVKEKEEFVEQFVRTSAHYIDELLSKSTGRARLPFSVPQIIDSD